MSVATTHRDETALVSDARAVGLLHELIATPSVSGEEANAVARFVDAAREFGLEAEIDTAGNGLAHRGDPHTARHHLMLLGHIDTVPGDIPVRLEAGVLHGRGAVDAKGPLAAMLMAAARSSVTPGVAITVAAAVGEETATSPGARHIRDHWRPTACVIGEPSGWDGVTLGYKGRLVARATASRECAHSAGPDASPGDAIVGWWGDVRRACEAMSDEDARVFDRVQCSVASMFSTSDGLRATAEMRVGWRLPPGVAPGEVQRMASELAQRWGVSIVASAHEEAYASPRADPVVGALSSAIRAQDGRPRHKLKTGTADMNVVGPVWRCPCAAYGPGDSALDHTPHEHVRVDEYLRSIEVLRAAIESRRWALGGGPLEPNE